MFLIRDPAATVPSLYKMSMEKKSHLTRFNPHHVGIHGTRKLYDFVASKSEVAPLVIDSDLVVANPEGTICLMCATIGIAYDYKMLTWEAGADNAKRVFNKFPGAHERAEFSTNVIKNLSPIDVELSSIALDAIKDNTPDYEYLKSKAVTPEDDLKLSKVKRQVNLFEI